MNQSLAIILGIVFFLTLARFYLAKHSREIHQNNVFQAKHFRKKDMEAVEDAFVRKNTWTMHACTVILIGIGTLMFIAFLHEEERPSHQNTVVTQP